MTDRIIVRDLLLRGIIGINPGEQDNPQDILINLALSVDTRPAAASDNIADAVDYGAIVRQVRSLVSSSRFGLVERLAEEIARLCLGDQRISSVMVRVEKPQIVPDAEGVGVEIHRRREANDHYS
jgi:FolB domain-containing protein